MQRVGTGSADTLLGSALGTDVLFGLGGDDLLVGDAGRDCLYGGDGRDRLLGGRGLDRLFGGDDADRLDGEDGTGDTLAGGAAHEGHGGDSLHGEAGKDVLTDIRGRAFVSGGSGDDRIDVRNAARRDRGTADTVSCGSGNDAVLADEADRVAADCEYVTRRKSPRTR
jgi:Ca2+-binding RTX toxin-like protein